MNLLGEADAFRYPSFAAYVAAVDAGQPAVNVAPWRHTALHSDHMYRLDRPATPAEIEAMRAQLSEALEHGALVEHGTRLRIGPPAPPRGNFIAGRTLAAAGAIRLAHAHRSATRSSQP